MNPTYNETAGIITLWVTGTAFAILMSGFILYFILQYRRRQLLHEKQQKERELLFQQELLEIQSEIKNESLNYISRELHDNIGQIASFLKMQIELVLRKSDKDAPEILTELRDHSQNLIDQIKALSRGLNSQNIERFGLVEMIQFEVDRCARLGGAKVGFDAPKYSLSLNTESSIFLYRVFQELLNNALKHSSSQEISISLTKDHSSISLLCKDNGKGFDADKLHPGSGLINLEQRCKHIGARLNIDSKIGKGASFLITLPLDNPETG